MKIRTLKLILLAVLAAGAILLCTACEQKEGSETVTKTVCFLVEGDEIAGFQIELDGNSRETDAEGLARFSNINRGNYTYRVTKQGYKDVEGTLAASAFDTESEEIAVAVRPEKTDDGANAGQTSQKDIRIVLQCEDGADGFCVTLNGQTLISSADGIVSFSDVGRGNYTFTVTKAGYQTYTGSISAEEFDADTDFISVTALLVEEQAPAIAKDVCITVENLFGDVRGFSANMGSVSSESGEDGTILFEDVAKGEYQVTIEKDGYEPCILSLPEYLFESQEDTIGLNAQTMLQCADLGTIGGENSIIINTLRASRTTEGLYFSIDQDAIVETDNERFDIYVQVGQEVLTTRTAQTFDIAVFGGHSTVAYQFKNGVSTAVKDTVERTSKVLNNHTYTEVFIPYTLFERASGVSVTQWDIFGLSFAFMQSGTDTDVYSFPGTDEIISRFDPSQYVRIDAWNNLFRSENNAAYAVVCGSTGEENVLVTASGVSVMSGPDGRYELEIEKKGKNTEVVFSKIGYLEQRQDLAFDAGFTYEIDVEGWQEDPDFAEPMCVFGKVFDLHGNAIAGAQAILCGADGGVIETVQADSAGVYTFETFYNVGKLHGLTVRIEAAGYLQKEIHLSSLNLSADAAKKTCEIVAQMLDYSPAELGTVTDGQGREFTYYVTRQAEGLKIEIEATADAITPNSEYMMFWFSVGDTVNGRNANCYYVRFYTDKIEFYSMQTGAWKLVNGSGVTGELRAKETGGLHGEYYVPYSALIIYLENGAASERAATKDDVIGIMASVRMNGKDCYLTGTNLTGNCSKFIRLGTDNKLFESTENKPSEG